MAKIRVTQDASVIVAGNNDQIDIEIPGGGSATIRANPSANVKKITVNFLDDTQSDRVTIDLSSFSQNGLRIDLKKYDPSDVVLVTGAFNTFVDPANPSDFVFEYVGADGRVYTGFIRAMDGGEKDLTDPARPITIICFADGTLIDTPRGAVPVERLRPGDMVTTLDNGPQPLRWVGRREIDATWLARHPELAPVTFLAGSLGDGLPCRDLTLSPNHRLLLTLGMAEILFGEADVLVAAKHLSCPQIDPSRGIAYNHLMFDRHEIVFSNGVPSESLYPGPQALTALDDAAMSEIRAIFPEALDPDGDTVQPARRVLLGYEARLLLDGLSDGALAA
jgi:hypothetical protein